MAEPPGSREEYDLLVVGAGPCGIAVGAAARQAGLRCVLVEKGALTQGIIDHPTYTVYFSGPEKLEIGGVPLIVAGDKPTRREALRYFRRVASYFALEVRQYHEVVGVEGERGDFTVQLRSREGTPLVLRARNVVVATGYYDAPRRLDAPGGDLPKVSYYFKEPFGFWEQDVLIIGGGNSAVDAALACWREGARVTVVHLAEMLDRGIKPWVRPDIENRITEGTIPVFWESRIAAVHPREVEIEHRRTGERVRIANDWILAMTGYEPDPWLLRSLGVVMDPESGVPIHDSRTMETNVPGVWVAGVVVSGFDANKIFIENGKLHGPLITAAIRSRTPAAG